MYSQCLMMMVYCSAPSVKYSYDVAMVHTDGSQKKAFLLLEGMVWLIIHQTDTHVCSFVCSNHNYGEQYVYYSDVYLHLNYIHKNSAIDTSTVT